MTGNLKQGKKLIFQSIYVGPKEAVKNYAGQIRNVISHHNEYSPKLPVLFGEVGVPFDINKKYALKSGDYKHQVNAFNAVLGGLDANLASYIIWYVVTY